MLQTALTFNLICTGTMVTAGGAQGNGSQPSRIEIRVDLSSRRFCYDDCRETQPIYSVSGTEIILRNETIPSESFSYFHRVNRESGASFSSVRMDGVTITSTGRCEPAPFTGFPARRF